MKHNVRHGCNWLHETNTRPVPRQRKQQAARRRGAIGLVVVLVLLLMLGTASAMTIARMNADRRQLKQHQVAELLDSALTSYDQLASPPAMLRLPVNEIQHQSVLIEQIVSGDQRQMIKATLYRNNKATQHLRVRRYRSSGPNLDDTTNSDGEE